MISDFTGFMLSPRKTIFSPNLLFVQTVWNISPVLLCLWSTSERVIVWKRPPARVKMAEKAAMVLNKYAIERGLICHCFLKLHMDWQLMLTGKLPNKRGRWNCDLSVTELKSLELRKHWSIHVRKLSGANNLWNPWLYTCMGWWHWVMAVWVLPP